MSHFLFFGSQVIGNGQNKSFRLAGLGTNKQTNKYLPVISAWLSALTLVAKKTQHFHFQTKIMGDKIKENTLGSTNGFLRNRVSNQVRVPRLQTQRV